MEPLDRLFDIIRTLRSENGCSWDRKQTETSMWRCLAEEVYELEDAIAKQDLLNICEELGDILFQLVFIIEIFQEKQAFSLSEIIEKVAGKMVRRHPHVWGDATVNTKQELDRQWEAIKAVEKSEAGTQRKSVLDAVPKGMPSLVRAMKVSKCVVKEGFDWDDIEGVIQCAKDELEEFESALASGDKANAMMEFGDVLFSLVNVARFAGFHPENSLAASTAKFEGRYRIMEKMLKERKSSLKDLSREQIDSFWESAKKDYDK